MSIWANVYFCCRCWCSFLNKFGLNTQTTTFQWNTGLGVRAGYSAREEGESWNHISFECCQVSTAWLIWRNFVPNLCTWESLCLFLVPFICISKSLLTTAYDSLFTYSDVYIIEFKLYITQVAQRRSVWWVLHVSSDIPNFKNDSTYLWLSDTWTGFRFRFPSTRQAELAHDIQNNVDLR